MIKRILALTLFAFLALAVCSQSVYTFHYSSGPDSSIIRYESILIRQPDGSAMTRIRLQDSLGKLSHLIEMNMQEEFYHPAPGNEMSDTLLYRPLDTLFIIGDPGLAFVPPVYWLVRTNGEAYMPSWISSEPVVKEDDKIKFSQIKYLDLGSSDKLLLRRFFNRNEPFFKNVMEPNTRGLSDSEKKMTLHFLGIANTNDPIIGPACGMSMRQLNLLFKSLSVAMGINYQFDSIAGKTYNRKKVIAAVKKINPSNNDIVVVYYMGHGFRKTADKRPFPHLDLRWDPNRNDYMEQSMSSEDIFDIVRKKQARFTLMLNDCCNTDPNTNNIVASPVPTQRESPIIWNVDNFRSLFLDPARISIIVTAADVEQRATSNNNFGGFFSFYFQTALKQQLGPAAKFVSWDVLISDARKQTIFKAERTYCDKPYIKENICRQYPLYRKIYETE
jgi:hypothetical protein